MDNSVSLIKFYSKEPLQMPITLEDGKILPAYLPDDDLVDAVNLALILNRPLLLMGEPGCGKTQLAEAVAYSLHGKEYPSNYFEWYIKSTTKSKDGLVYFDSLARLRDAQAQDIKAQDINHYKRTGPLAQAFEKSSQKSIGDIPCVILIDEIDKADIDFPNDLLLELDKKIIKIDETSETIIAGDVPPLIIITSNREKDLPPAFLRRCLYHYIEFPDTDRLKQILNARIGNLKITEPKLDAMVKRFKSIRDDNKQENAERNLSTSELIDWFTVINRYFSIENYSGLSKEEKRLADNLQKIVAETGIAFPPILIKNWDAYNRYRKEESNPHVKIE